MFQSTEKNKGNKDLFYSCLILSIIVFYVLLASINSFERGEWAFSSMSETFWPNFFSIMNPLNFINYGVSAKSLGISFFVIFIFAAACAVIYLDGRKNEYDTDWKLKEQGDAHWLLDIEKLEKNGKNYKEPETGAKYRNDMMSEDYSDNVMFDNKYGLSMNARKTLRNLHTFVIGGSGAGKTRFYIKPNILQMNASYIITDPSGELYRDMGQMLLDNNYDVRVFNTFDTNRSMQYNPLAYINNDADVTALITTLIKNTGEASGDNKYFDDATKLLLSAIILFLVHYCPKEEQNFSHVMQLVVAADVPENARNPKSDLDRIFEKVELVDPHGLALKMYKSFKSTSGKSLKSVLSSTATRLTVFNYQEIENLTCNDTVSLTTIGDEKTALFIITPPTDNGFNFLVAMMYSQLFSKLYYHDQFECHYLLTDNDYIARPFVSEAAAKYTQALLFEQKNNPNKKIIDFVYDDEMEKYKMLKAGDAETDKKPEFKEVIKKDGEEIMRELRKETVYRFRKTPEVFKVEKNTDQEAGSPIPIRMLMDEFANINEIPDFLTVLATIRKYNISIVIVLQALSQLKKHYEKDYEAIVGNCDTFIFLGGNDQDTLKYISERLGFMTIRTQTRGQSFGKSKSSNANVGIQKRELMTTEELARLSNDEQIIMVRGARPFRLHKFKLELHPNFNQSADGEGAKLIVQEQLDLEEKYRKINEKLGVIQQKEKQDSINERARRSMDAWLDEDVAVEDTSDGNNGDGNDFEFF